MDDPIFSLKGKICLVTGASTGLGAHFARLLLSRGAIVVGVARTEIDWDTGVFDGCFDYFLGDLCEQQTVEKLFSYIKDTYGKLDVVINNAGISRIERAMSFNADAMREILEINVIAAGLVASNAAHLMRVTGTKGSIINVTSVMADSAITGLSSYSATKSALEQLTRGMANEWARHDIRVNNLAPGWFPTAMTNDYFEKGMEGVLKARVPMGRLGMPSDLDGVCILLASNASRYMTGSTINVDGGFSLIN